MIRVTFDTYEGEMWVVFERGNEIVRMDEGCYAWKVSVEKVGDGKWGRGGFEIVEVE